jgi:SAM-dependent methyltransferase
MKDRFAEPYRDRVRAESFGAVADDYDRLRPPYADAMLDDLARLGPAAVLDVACGTGKVAAALAARGLVVTGVEPDARMAAVARARGLTVEESTFEAWRDDGRSFDLVTCANAWHWIDPSLGLAQMARVLRPGGHFALFFAIDVLEAPVAAALAAVYAALAPYIPIFFDPKPRAEVDHLAGATLFSSIERRTYPNERTLSAETWVDMMGTVSLHRVLAPERFAALQEGVREAIERLGGSVRAQCATQLWLARRAA